MPLRTGAPAIFSLDKRCESRAYLFSACPPGVSEKAYQWFHSCWNRSAVNIPNANVSGPEIVRTKDGTSDNHKEGVTHMDHTQLQLGLSRLSVGSQLPEICSRVVSGSQALRFWLPQAPSSDAAAKSQPLSPQL